MNKLVEKVQHHALRELVEAENLEAVKSYLKTGRKKTVLQKDADGRNALYYAIFTRNLDIVKALVEYGFNPADIDDECGATTLHLASSEGMGDLVEYLLDSVNMDVNALDKKKQNPLSYALMSLDRNSNNNENLVPRTEYIKIAWLLVACGARFQDNMLRTQSGLEFFEGELLHYIHNGIKTLDNEHLIIYKNFIQFLNDTQNTYLRFFKDISTRLPDKTVYLTSAFKTQKNKIPLAFGRQFSTWNFADSQKAHLVPMSEEKMKPMVFDLAAIAPLLIYPGDTEAETIVLFSNFVASLQKNFKPTDVKQINILTQPNHAFTTSIDEYFNQSLTVNNAKDATNTIVDLSSEVDKRKKLSKGKLKNELPIICWIDDLSQITNKTAIGGLQNIAFAGKDVGVYLITVARGKLSSVIRANFQSVITFHTTTATESKKYTGCPNATELELDEMLFVSPFVSGIQPLHIKMEKM